MTYELSDALRYDFPGSPPSRLFAPEDEATVINDTVVANAATYYGCSPLSETASIGDLKIKAESSYSQLVPSTQTETAALDQLPSAAPVITLATSPRTVEVTQHAHTQRLRVTQETRGYNYVSLLKPLPAPGSISVSYRAMERWYTLTDNGSGALTGTGGGSGSVSYVTGSISITLSALPDADTNIIISWADKVAFTNRSGQASWRPPEFCFQVDANSIAPNSVTVTWTSGGETKTMTDDGSGQLSGDASGTVSYASGTLFIKMNSDGSNMIDAGGEFSIDYQVLPTVTEILTGLTPDASGVVALTFAQTPEPGSVCAAWITTREIDETSGVELAEQSASRVEASGTTVVTYPRTITSIPEDLLQF